MFDEAHFGFPVGPVLVAPEAQDGQQLRLRELVFAKAATIVWYGGGGYVQCHLSEAHQTHFGYGWERVSPERIAASLAFAPVDAKWNLGCQQNQRLLVCGIVG
ncbi:MAG: hypothetical protein WBC78_17075 [Candidatus Sulfotelmatobacter sp.]